MAGIMRLKVGTVKINCEPQRGYRRPDDIKRIIDYAQDGTPYITDFFTKKKWEIPLTAIAAQASTINKWHRSKNAITLFPNWTQATPGATVSVYITNLERPFQPIYDFADGSTTWSSHEGGTLILRER